MLYFKVTTKNSRKKFRKCGFSEIPCAMGVKGSELAYEIDDKSSDVFKLVKKNVKKNSEQN